MAKSVEVEATLDKMAQRFFGRSRKDAGCVCCGSQKTRPEDFRDALSWREFGLSHFCQVCQDKTFGV